MLLSCIVFCFDLMNFMVTSMSSTSVSRAGQAEERRSRETMARVLNTQVVVEYAIHHQLPHRLSTTQCWMSFYHSKFTHYRAHLCLYFETDSRSQKEAERWAHAENCENATKIHVNKCRVVIFRTQHQTKSIYVVNTKYWVCLERQIAIYTWAIFTNFLLAGSSVTSPILLTCVVLNRKMAGKITPKL